MTMNDPMNEAGWTGRRRAIPIVDAGKVALVTGGNGGIGLATAKRFVGEGAYVFITGRRPKELDAAVKDIGKNVTAVQGDVSKLADLDRLFAQIKKEKGSLDIVFTNAGIAKYAPLGEITEEFYNSIFDINVKGVLFTVQKALPLLGDGASTSPASNCLSMEESHKFENKNERSPDEQQQQYVCR
jgi:NAD(P)-dependent dehydrogenase (short-subunit alcohol dehydrogenase family)